MPNNYTYRFSGKRPPSHGHGHGHGPGHKPGPGPIFPPPYPPYPPYYPPYPPHPPGNGFPWWLLWNLGDKRR